MTRRRWKRQPYSICAHCRAAIRWCETSTGDAIPLNISASDDGDVVITAAVSGASGRPIARVLTRLEIPDHQGNRFTRHKCKKRRAS